MVSCELLGRMPRQGLVSLKDVGSTGSYFPLVRRPAGRRGCEENDVCREKERKREESDTMCCKIIPEVDLKEPGQSREKSIGELTMN